MTVEPNEPDAAAASPSGGVAPRPVSYRQWMVLAEEEYVRLVRLLRGLDGHQWSVPTDCDGWVVRDVVAHLAGAAAATASVRELMRQARGSRRFGTSGDLVDRMNRLQVEERQFSSSGELTEELESTARRGVKARRRIPAPVRAVAVPFGPPLGIRPLGYLTGRIYTRDAWMHRIDLARATGTPLELTPEHDGALVEDLVAEWTAARGTAYRVDLGGPAGGRWTTGSPDRTVRMDAVEFARTLSGRAGDDEALMPRVPF